MNNRNSQQDVNIARLEEKFKAFEKRFDSFVNNHFASLKAEVKWIRNLIILSILVPILLFLLTRGLG